MPKAGWYWPTVWSTPPDQGVGEMIDLATLTGAKVVALGEETTALYANRDELADNLRPPRNAQAS